MLRVALQMEDAGARGACTDDMELGLMEAELRRFLAPSSRTMKQVGV